MRRTLRHRCGAKIAAAAAAALVPSLSALAANTEMDVTATATNSPLDSSSSYSGNTLPTTANDVTFTAGTAYNGTFTLNGSAQSIGTLDDLNTTPLTITGTQTLTLNGGTNVVAPTAFGGLGADAMFVANGASLTLNAPLALASTVTSANNFDIVGTATASINSGITGAGGFTKLGAGVLTLSGADAYTGNTVLSAGAVTASQTSGTPLGTGSLNLNAATLNLTPTSGSSAVSLSAATAASTVFTYGPGGTLALNRDGNTSLAFTVGSGSGAVFARSGAGGTLVIQPASGIASLGITGGESFVVNGTAPTVTNGIVSPSIIGQSSNTDSTGTFLTYGAAGTTGFSQFTGYTTQSANFTPASTSEIDDVTASVTVTPGTSNPYALRVGNGNTLTIGGTSTTLTEAGGGVILNGGTITGNTLGFGTAEGLIYASSAGGTINSVISGSGGITLFGPGKVIFGTSTTTIANTFTGNININGGTFAAVITQLNNAANASPIGAVGARNITLNGGTFEMLAGSSQYDTQAGTQSFVVGAGGGTLQIDAGGLLLNDAGQLVNSSGGTLTKSGASYLQLQTQTYTFTGALNIIQGTVQLDGASVLSGATSVSVNPATTGLIGAAGATLDIDNGSTFPTHLNLAGTGISSGGALYNGSSGNNVTLTGGITLTANTSLGGAGNLTVSTAGISDGSPSNGYSLTKVGAGTVNLGTANTYTGGTVLSAGTLIANNATALGSGPVTVSAGTLNVASSTLTTGTITLNGGTLSTAPGAVTITNAVAAGSAAHTIAPGGIYTGGGATGGTTGTMNVGALGVTNLSTLNFDLTTPTGSDDLINVTGPNAFSASGTIPVTLGELPSQTGTYHLVSFSSSTTPAFTGANFSGPASEGTNRLTFTYAIDEVGSTNRYYVDLIATGTGASSYTFTNATTPAGDNFGTATNYTPNGIPGVAGDSVTFNNGYSGGSAYTINLNGQTPHLGTVTFANSGTAGYVLAAGTGGSIAFDNAGAAAVVNNSTNNNSITAPVVLDSPANVTIASGTTLTMSGVISGGGSLNTTAASAGTLILGGTAANTYSGGSTINGGTVQLKIASGLGAGTAAVGAGAVLDLNGIGSSTPLAINGTGIGGTGALINSSATAATVTGGVNFASAATIGGTGNITFTTTALSGSGAITKVGANTVTVSIASSDTGAVTVNAGNLTLNTSNGSTGAIQAPSITVNSGATLTLTNSDTIGYTGGRDALFINSGGTVVNNTTGTRDTISNVITMVGGTLGGTSVGDGATGAFSINAGISATSDAAGNPAVVSANVSLQSSATFTVTRGPAVTGNAPDLIVSGAGNTSGLAISPYNSGGNGIVKAGNGIMELTGKNTYTGTTTISAGTLEAASTASFASTNFTLTGGTFQIVASPTIPTAAVFYPQGGTLQVLNDGAGSNGTITGPSNAITFTGATTSTINVGPNTSANTGNTVVLGAFNVPGASANTINFNASNGYLVQIPSLGLPGGAGQTITLVPTGTSLTITGNVTNNGTGVAGNYDTLVLDGTSTGNIIQGVISDASGATADSARYTPVTKQNTSTWTLAGANTYTGNTTLSAGTLILTNPLAMQNSHAALNGGTLDLRYDSSATFSNNKQTSTFSIAFGANTNIDVDAADASGVSGSTLSMLDMGINGSYTVTTTNNGGANSYNLATGAFTINGNFNPAIANNMVNGATTLASLGESTSTTAAQTITFNGTSASAVTAVTGPITQNGTNALTVTQSGAGTLLLNGASTYTGATNVNAGTLALGYNTANSVGASIGTSAVTVASGATFAARPGVNGATNALGSTLTLNAGARFSMVDGAYSTLNVTGATQLAPASGTAVSLSFDVGGTGSTADQIAIAGAGTDGAAGAQITLNGIGTTAPAVDTTYPLITASGGLNQANFSLTSNRVVINGVAYQVALTGGTTFEDAYIVGALSSTTAYYTGNGGTSALNATANGGATTNFSSDTAGTIDLGTQPSSAQDVYFTATSVSSSTPVTIASLGQAYTFNSLNFTSNAPAITINNGGSANTLTIESGGVTVANGSGAPTVNVPVILGASQTVTNNSTTNTLTFSDGLTAGNSLLTFAGAGATTISGAAAFTTNVGVTVNSGAGAVTISAPVTIGGAAIFTNNSANTLTLGGAVAAGGNAIAVTGSGNTAIGGNLTSTSTLTKTGAGTLNFNGASNSLATLNLNSNSTVNIAAGAVLSLSNSGASTIQSTTGGTISGPGSLKFSSNTYPNFADNGTLAGFTLTINANIISNGTGASTDGFEVYGGSTTAGTDILTGQNTFTGDINIDGGTLQVANIGNAGTSDTTSPLGEGTNILILNGGTCGLRYTGTGESTNRVIYLEGTTTAGFIDQSGTGTLNFTANFATPGAGAKTLVLQGSTAGIGEISGIIPNNSTTNTTAITKAGTGTWILAGANTYSGGTTINDNGGILAVTNSAGLGTGAVTIGSGTGNAVTGEIQLSNNVAITGVPTVNFAQSRTLISGGGFAQIENLSGSNSLSANLKINGTGGTGANILSTAGTLTLSGNLINTVASSSRTFTFSGAGATIVSGTVTDTTAGTTTTGISLAGPGLLTLTNAANTYSGPTTITGGTLLVSNPVGGSNSGTGTSSVTVTTGVIGGSGSIAGPASIGAAGTLSPGAGGSPAILTIGSGSGTSVLSFASNTSTYQVNITGAGDSGTGLARAGATYDSVNNANTSTTPLALASARLSLVDNAVASGTYDILQNAHDDGMTAGQFFTYNNGSSIVNLTNGSTFTGGANAFTILYDVNSTDTGAGSDIVLVAAATPEPAALGLLAVGAGGLLARRRRRAAKHRA